MVISFYDQIPHFIDREDTLVGFSKPSIIERTPTSEYYEERSEKKQAAIREMKARIIQYTYKV